VDARANFGRQHRHDDYAAAVNQNRTVRHPIRIQTTRSSIAGGKISFLDVFNAAENSRIWFCQRPRRLLTYLISILNRLGCINKHWIVVKNISRVGGKANTH
jgi:hypothetical protein